MATTFGNQENRPLKKLRLGPPDVYPQEPRQKEDELSAINVKQGFNSGPSFDVNDIEYGSARKQQFNLAKMGTFLTAIINKKTEINTFQDSCKKKVQINKEQFWPVTPRTKPALDGWLRDLAGNKSLMSLAKKVPIMNKREEVFTTLCEYNIVMVRAAWYIKMAAAYAVTISETKIKKRQTVDPSVDWAQALTRFLKEQLSKIAEHYVGPSSSSQTSFLTATQTTNQVDLDLTLKLWNYCSTLLRHLYLEGLLDRQEVLIWIVEQVERYKHNEDSMLKIILTQVLMYLDDLTQSVFLSRRLAHYSCKKILYYCNEASCAVTSPSPAANGTTTTPSTNPLLLILNEYNNCPQHRTIVLNLSCIVLAIMLRCPSSLVWFGTGESKSHSIWLGSPLDLLPCMPSHLPMPPGSRNQWIRTQVVEAEHQIRQRSRAVEVRWSTDKWQQSITGHTTTKVLNSLDVLDRHNFEKVESNNSLDSLYNKVFVSSHSKDSAEMLQCDEPIVMLLCEWAVSPQRVGDHRAIVVAKLLEKRQGEISSEKFPEGDLIEEKEGMTGTETAASNGYPTFQELLLQFLDNKAPVLEESVHLDHKRSFTNLIHLFSELIRHDVFSHDVYISTLISRGDLISPAIGQLQEPMGIDLLSVKSAVESNKPELIHDEDMKAELRNQNFDPEIDFFSTFEEFRSSPDPTEPNPARLLRTEREQATFNPPPAPSSSTAPAQTTPEPTNQKRPSRHLQYAMHFAIPQEDIYTHESNQRLIILYGVGKARDTARHIVKKITKEIMKLFNKKNSLDVSSGPESKSKKKKDKEDSAQTFEALFNKFQKLSYHDQHLVTSCCASSIQESIISFLAGNSVYVPVMENVSFLFDLMEYALNIAGLLDFVIQLLKYLSDVEAQLHAKCSSLAGVYTTSLCLCIVAILRKYHAYLLVSQEHTAEAFEGLCRVVKHVGNPSDCTSAERCILAYLYDLYTSCSYLKLKYCEFFGGACAKVKQTLYASIQPCASNLLWDPNVMADAIENAKSRPDPQLVKQLNENPGNRYNFVCYAVVFSICNVQGGTERLNEISVLCAELTACCNMLCSEWLGVLKALCCSSNNNCGFIDVLTQVDVSDLSIHDPLAVFTAILIARHCFSLQDLVLHVALPSLLAACPSAGGGTEAEPGARLTCHLLLRLFKTDQVDASSPLPTVKNSSHIKASCDRHLLTATHDSIGIGPVLAVLKAILILGDSCDSGNVSKSSSSSSDRGATSGDIISTLLSSLDDDELMLGQPPNKNGMESAGLSDFAKYALKAICAQPWVREKFLKEPESLLTTDLLLDNQLTAKQAQQLVQLICYPDGVPGPSPYDDDEPDQKDVIARILSTLDQWTLRVSWLELQLMQQQTPSSELNDLLDDIAKSTIEVFQQQTEYKNILCSTECPSPTLNSFRQETGTDKSVWLLAPLIAKLSSSVQGKVLREAAQVLESGNDFWTSRSKTEKERNLLKSTSLLGHQPFLALVLNCLKGQDEQREDLLKSVLDQMEKFIQNAKEDRYPDDAKLRQIMQEALQLRLSLVGGMFDTIVRSNTNTTDWSVLLIQLISYGVIDTQSNCDLFYTVLDMLSCLVHGTLISDSSSERGDENKKSYLNLVKKLKKELGDKHTEGITMTRQLIPFPKRQYDIISLDPHGTRTDWKGNKSVKASRAKQGHQIAQKNKVSPWDLLEGHRNSSMLPLAWFGAVRLERKQHTYDEQFRLSLYHTHNMRKPASHYLEPPPLPPEDLDPPPEKIPKMKDEMMGVPEVRHVPDMSKIKKQPKRRPRGRSAATPTNSTHPYMQPPMNMPYPRDPPMYPQGAGPPPGNWGYGPQSMPPQPQQPYYAQQPMAPGGPGYSGQMGKAVLSDFIRSGRQRAGGWQGAPQSMQIRQQIMRHQLMQQQQHQQQSRLGEPGMYGPQQSMQQGPPQSMQQMQGMGGQFPPGYSGMQQGMEPGPVSQSDYVMTPQQANDGLMMTSLPPYAVTSQTANDVQAESRGSFNSTRPDMATYQNEDYVMTPQQANDGLMMTSLPPYAVTSQTANDVQAESRGSFNSTRPDMATYQNEGMMSPNYPSQPSYPQSQPNMMSSQQGGPYMAQAGPPSGPYPQQRYQQAMPSQGIPGPAPPQSMQGPPQGPMMGNYSQAPQQPQQPPPGYSSTMGAPQQHPQMLLQQQQQQQRLIAQQQQQQKQQLQTKQQQQTAALVAQLQRQLSGNPPQQQAPPQAPPPQYGAFQQQPPPQY